MNTKVFLSVGRTSSDQQEEFVQSIEEYLRSHDLTPQTVGRTYFSSQQPLKAIDELMRQCAGSVILAYERVYIPEATDRRGSDNEKRLLEITLPTIWNQIEAAMAYTLGHPLMVIVEDGLREEGLLEHGYDWYVQRVSLDKSALYEPEFTGVFTDWQKRVLAYQEQKQQTAVSNASNAATTTNSTPKISGKELIALQTLIATRFNEDELRIFCRFLDLDYENLAADSKQTRIMEIIDYFERRDSLAELIAVGQQTRPDIPWPTL